jgi:hypothetical protein
MMNFIGKMRMVLQILGWILVPLNLQLTKLTSLSELNLMSFLLMSLRQQQHLE